MVNIQFRALDVNLPNFANDKKLLMNWLGQSHVSKWWGEPQAEVQEIIAGLMDGEISAYIFMSDDQEIGYIQYYLVGNSRQYADAYDAPWLNEFSDHVVGLDITIGRADKLGIGLGSAALREMITILRKEGYQDFIIDPEPGNARAIAAYEKAGFEHYRTYKGQKSDTYLMFQKI